MLEEHLARMGVPYKVIGGTRFYDRREVKDAMAYLRAHPGVNQDMTIMVRQLAPTPQGLPLEIYCFSNDIRWVYYEGIMADVFDHLMTIVPEFGLEIFEEPTGGDFLNLNVGE